MMILIVEPWVTLLVFQSLPGSGWAGSPNSYVAGAAIEA